VKGRSLIGVEGEASLTDAYIATGLGRVTDGLKARVHAFWDGDDLSGLGGAG
jgi:hypothetical protein